MTFPVTMPPLTKGQQLIAAGVGLFFIAGIPSIYFYSQYRSMQDRLANPAKYAQQESNALVAKVAELMTLPSDETPTIAFVQDIEKLKNQPFFSHAANGDRVLIYTKAKKAILYRPAINKIIDVAPLNIGAAPASSSAQVAGAAMEVSVTFMLDNGTGVVGLTKKYELELKNKVKNAVIADRDNAKRRDYAKTLLIDVAGNKSALAKELAQTLGVDVSTLPSGEATPSSDFLIIIGADKK